MREEFAAILVKGGVPPEMATKLAGFVEPGVLLTSRPSSDDQVALGASKLGGSADLPEDRPWPSWKGSPLAFLGQIDLAELRAFSCCAALPGSGLLSFFYDQEQRTWGFDPADRGSWAVLFSEGRPLTRRKPPAGTEVHYTVCSLAPREVATLPELHSEHYDRAGLTPVERDVMRQIAEQADGHGVEGARHRVFGYPSLVQGDMELECQLASHGINCGSSPGYESARAKQLAAGARDWRMLLQLDSDENPGFEWGDLGRLFFWMTEDALKRRAFDEAWMVLQCS